MHAIQGLHYNVKFNQAIFATNFNASDMAARRQERQSHMKMNKTVQFTNYFKNRYNHKSSIILNKEHHTVEKQAKIDRNKSY